MTDDVDIDIRAYEELEQIEISIKCRCGNKHDKNYHKDYNGRPNQLSVDWTNQKMIFKCGFCGYNTQFDL